MRVDLGFEDVVWNCAGPMTMPACPIISDGGNQDVVKDNHSAVTAFCRSLNTTRVLQALCPFGKSQFQLTTFFFFINLHKLEHYMEMNTKELWLFQMEQSARRLRVRVWFERDEWQFRGSTQQTSLLSTWAKAESQEMPKVGDVTSQHLVLRSCTPLCFSCMPDTNNQRGEWMAENIYARWKKKSIGAKSKPSGPWDANATSYARVSTAWTHNCVKDRVMRHTRSAMYALLVPTSKSCVHFVARNWILNVRRL